MANYSKSGLSCSILISPGWSWPLKKGLFGVFFNRTRVAEDRGSNATADGRAFDRSRQGTKNRFVEAKLFSFFAAQRKREFQTFSPLFFSGSRTRDVVFPPTFLTGMYHLLFSPPPPRPFSTLYFISLYFVYTVYFLHFISTLYVVQKPRKGRGERNRKEGERGGGRERGRSAAAQVLRTSN